MTSFFIPYFLHTGQWSSTLVSRIGKLKAIVTLQNKTKPKNTRQQFEKHTHSTRTMVNILQNLLKRRCAPVLD